ncbi:lysophospholipase [Laetiporus sulphureus 93-53]|uniref:Lysophospholipase n=1 Tax=Laetiporus sulphureus 93-53 TaxID=1314785 RepID=A0A165DQT0_9APHY|nr:lysophospholipase [Laetiporus sulphureus 93-53]KZT05425.1 lysophospholipase [Laetiporus sulphureus 93-53]
MSDAKPYTEAWLPGPDGHQFYTRTYRPRESPHAAVVFIHGFAEHVARHEHAHSNWATKHTLVFTFDQRGFGRTALDPERRSKDASYGKTSHQQQMRDIEWWVRHVKRDYPDLPLFLFGHSMGGALVLAFPTQTEPPPSKDTVEMLSGVIASSPLILQTTPPPRLLRKVGGAAALVVPWMPFPAKVPPEDLSHDPVVNNAIGSDPLIKEYGTLRGLADMLDRGEKVLWFGYQYWPKKLPILIVHGTDDKVTSYKASEEFFGKIDAEDKKLSLYPGAYHEIMNEPDGVKEKFWDECVAWIHEHIPKQSDPQLAKL